MLETGSFDQNTKFEITQVYGSLLGSNDELMDFLWTPAAKTLLGQFGIEFAGPRNKPYRILTNLPYFWLPSIGWYQYEAPIEVAGADMVDAMELEMSRISVQEGAQEENYIDVEGGDLSMSDGDMGADDEDLPPQPLPGMPPAEMEEQQSSDSEEEIGDGDVDGGPARRPGGRPRKAPKVVVPMDWTWQKSAAEINGEDWKNHYYKMKYRRQLAACKNDGDIVKLFLSKCDEVDKISKGSEVIGLRRRIKSYQKTLWDLRKSNETANISRAQSFIADLDCSNDKIAEVVTTHLPDAVGSQLTKSLEGRGKRRAPGKTFGLALNASIILAFIATVVQTANGKRKRSSTVATESVSSSFIQIINWCGELSESFNTDLITHVLKDKNLRDNVARRLAVLADLKCISVRSLLSITKELEQAGVNVYSDYAITKHQQILFITASERFGLVVAADRNLHYMDMQKVLADLIFYRPDLYPILFGDDGVKYVEFIAMTDAASNKKRSYSFAGIRPQHSQSFRDAIAVAWYQARDTTANYQKNFSLFFGQFNDLLATGIDLPQGHVDVHGVICQDWKAQCQAYDMCGTSYCLYCLQDKTTRCLLHRPCTTCVERNRTALCRHCDICAGLPTPPPPLDTYQLKNGSVPPPTSVDMKKEELAAWCVLYLQVMKVDPTRLADGPSRALPRTFAKVDLPRDLCGKPFSGYKVDLLRTIYDDARIKYNVTLYERFAGDECFIDNAKRERVVAALLFRYTAHAINAHVIQESVSSVARSDELEVLRDLLHETLIHEFLVSLNSRQPPPDAFVHDPILVIACLLHCFMRTAGKLVRLLGSAISAKYSDDEILIRLEAMAAVINKQLKTNDEHGSGCFKFEQTKTKGGQKSVSFELTGHELRRLFTKSDESVVIAFVTSAFPDDESERTSFLDVFLSYRAMMIEISKGEYVKDINGQATEEKYWTKERIWHLQDLCDHFGCLFLRRFDVTDVTPYIHMIIGGHLTEIMHTHGSISKFQQQAWERVMGEVKCVLLRVTCQNRKQRTATEAMAPYFCRKTIMCLANWKYPKGGVADALVEKCCGKQKWWENSKQRKYKDRKKQEKEAARVEADKRESDTESNEDDDGAVASMNDGNNSSVSSAGGGDDDEDEDRDMGGDDSEEEGGEDD